MSFLIWIKEQSVQYFSYVMWCVHAALLLPRPAWIHMCRALYIYVICSAVTGSPPVCAHHMLSPHEAEVSLKPSYAPHLLYPSVWAAGELLMWPLVSVLCSWAFTSALPPLHSSSLWPLKSLGPSLPSIHLTVPCLHHWTPAARLIVPITPNPSHFPKIVLTFS